MSSVRTNFCARSPGSRVNRFWWNFHRKCLTWPETNLGGKTSRFQRSHFYPHFWTTLLFSYCRPSHMKSHVNCSIAGPAIWKVTWTVLLQTQPYEKSRELFSYCRPSHMKSHVNCSPIAGPATDGCDRSWSDTPRWRNSSFPRPKNHPRNNTHEHLWFRSLPAVHIFLREGSSRLACALANKSDVCKFTLYKLPSCMLHFRRGEGLACSFSMSDEINWCEK